MNEQNNWKKEFDVNIWLHNTYGLTDDSLLNAGEIEELCQILSRDIAFSTAQQMKEKMKACVPEMRVIPDEKNSLSALAAHTHNICREQTLSAIESLEI